LQWRSWSSREYLRKIGDVDKGVVERGKDTGDTEDELTCTRIVSTLETSPLRPNTQIAIQDYSPSRV